MTCKQVKENIPSLVRRELSGYARVPVMHHLQGCNECKDEYKQYLKIFYSIDLELLSRPILTVPVAAMLQTVQQHEPVPNVLHLFSTKVFYIAAAIVIMGIVLIGYYSAMIIPDQKSLLHPPLSEQISQLEPGPVPSLLNSRISAMVDADRISLTFIEDQLRYMQKRGIARFNFNTHSLPLVLYKSEVLAPMYDKSVSIANCLQMIQTVKKYKSYLTLSELVSFLYNLEKQGA
jgi:hypothetical protein